MRELEGQWMLRAPLGSSYLPMDRYFKKILTRLPLTLSPRFPQVQEVNLCCRKENCRPRPHPIHFVTNSHLCFYGPTHYYLNHLFFLKMLPMSPWIGLWTIKSHDFWNSFFFVIHIMHIYAYMPSTYSFSWYHLFIL